MVTRVSSRATVDMASKQTWVGAGQGCLWEPRKMPPLAAGPHAVPPGLASLCPTVPAPALCALFFLKGPSPSPPPSLSSAPHTGPWGGISICGGPALPRLPSSPGAPPPGSLGHCPVADRPTPLLLHMLIGSWTNWPRVLLPLGLCTSCSIRNTHPHLSHLGLLSIKYPPVTALWGGY